MSKGVKLRKKNITLFQTRMEDVPVLCEFVIKNQMNIITRFIYLFIQYFEIDTKQVKTQNMYPHVNHKFRTKIGNSEINFRYIICSIDFKIKISYKPILDIFNSVNLKLKYGDQITHANFKIL